jgi:ribosome-associated protein
LRDVSIHTEFITLSQFLKWAGLVGTGAEAKALIESGAVCVNNEVERRRNRKLRDGDVVQFGANQLRVRRQGNSG